jgi:hypothetical protein
MQFLPNANWLREKTFRFLLNLNVIAADNHILLAALLGIGAVVVWVCYVIGGATNNPIQSDTIRLSIHEPEISQENSVGPP